MSRIAVLHPGHMGAAVGAALTAEGHIVHWIPAGRSAETSRRAERAGLDAREEVSDCDVVLSICPPAAAVDTARRCAGFTGLYVDANAISPETAAIVAGVINASGGTYVDGGIIGPPPVTSGSTRLYLSGDNAADIAALFTPSFIEATVIDGAFSASALKMVYASWTKISAALLIAARETAAYLQIEASLLSEWARSQPGVAERSAAAHRDLVAKGWRWEEEMRQIADTFASSGQPAEFGQAAAQVFSRSTRPTAT